MSVSATLPSVAPVRQSPAGRMAALTGAALTPLAARCRTLHAAWRGRRALAAMAGMTRAELRDIGLLPGDLVQVQHLRYGSDPTEILSRAGADRSHATPGR